MTGGGRERGSTKSQGQPPPVTHTGGESCAKDVRPHHKHCKGCMQRVHGYNKGHSSPLRPDPDDEPEPTRPLPSRESGPIPASNIAAARSPTGPARDRSASTEASPSPGPPGAGSRACTAATAAPRAPRSAGSGVGGTPPPVMATAPPPALPTPALPSSGPRGSSRGVASSGSTPSVAQPQVVASPTGVISSADDVAAEDEARWRGGSPGAPSPGPSTRDNTLRSERVISNRRSPAPKLPAPPPAEGDVDRDVDGR